MADFASTKIRRRGPGNVGSWYTSGHWRQSAKAVALKEGSTTSVDISLVFEGCIVRKSSDASVTIDVESNSRYLFSTNTSILCLCKVSDNVLQQSTITKMRAMEMIK